MKKKKETMDVNQLKEKHEYHKEFGDDWKLYGVIKRSGDDLVEYALQKHSRESQANYDERLRDGVVFNLGKKIVEIFNFYLNEMEVITNIDKLKNNDLWEIFKKDSDLNGTDYHDLMIEARKWASYYGAIGILVNKPQAAIRTRQYEIDNRIYPYCTLYSLPNIYDWKFTRNKETHRMELTYLKLYEGSNTWTIWTPTRWQRWALNSQNIPFIEDEGDNLLNEIPFLWMLNLRDMEYPEIGISDVIDIGKITCSIAQNLSSADEIIKWAGFPVLRMPMKRVDLGAGGGLVKTDDGDIAQEVAIGQSGVLDFDPSLGDGGKPDWMPTEILEPIEAILKIIDRKAEEAYSLSYLTGVRSQRTSGSGEGQTSGLSLRYELSQLKSVLIGKSTNSIEAQYKIIYFWLKWQNETAVPGAKHEIKQSHDFNIDEMAVALDNLIQAFGAVLSKTFREAVQKKIALTVLPDLSQDQKDKVVTEIATNTPDKIELQTQITNRALVKPASRAAGQQRPEADDDV